MYVKIQSPLDWGMVSHMLKLLLKPKLMSIKVLEEGGYRCPHLLLNCATRPGKTLTEALLINEIMESSPFRKLQIPVK